MTGPRQLRTCSHPINAQMLTGVCQAVRMFSPCKFHVYVKKTTRRYTNMCGSLFNPFKLLEALGRKHLIVLHHIKLHV